jgi:hypothetical protein
MRRATALAAAAVLVPGVLAGGSLAGASAQRHAALRITRMDPVTVRGTGFRPSEPVLIRVRATMTSARRSVTAGAQGAFTVTVSGIQVGHCGRLAVTAIGARGSRASIVRRLPLPACNPV